MRSTNAFVTNCVIVGNTGSYGGGASSCLLYNCRLSGNSAVGVLVTRYPYGGYQWFPGSGGGAVGSVLYNCTLGTNQASYGGGASRGTLYNCALTDNSAASGGGAAGATLYNCTLAGNSAGRGAGASFCTLKDCTLAGNYSTNAGGAVSDCTVQNCVLYFNTAPNYAGSNTINFCCTTPLPTNGVGNITNDPLFVDTNRWSNLRLQSNSPCINAGNNAYVTNSTDVDGNPRIVSGTVGIGAYEYQGAGSVISYAWLQQNGLPTDGSADYADPDHDGLNNWQEWVCRTCPTNAQSALHVVSARPDQTNVMVTWLSVDGVSYFLECSTNLAASPCFNCVATNILGQADTTTYADTNAVGLGPLFYRVGVKLR